MGAELEDSSLLINEYCKFYYDLRPKEHCVLVTSWFFKTIALMHLCPMALLISAHHNSQETLFADEKRLWTFALSWPCPPANQESLHNNDKSASLMCGINKENRPRFDYPGSLKADRHERGSAIHQPGSAFLSISWRAHEKRTH